MGRLIPSENVRIVLRREHAPYLGPLLSGLPAENLVVQPANRGTAPAGLYGAASNLAGPLAIVPSDHYVSDDERFMAHVDRAFQIIRSRPDLIVLLGVSPEAPEPEFGWIEPGEALAGPWSAPGVGWSDLGRPSRVLAAQAHAGTTPRGLTASPPKHSHWPSGCSSTPRRSTMARPERHTIARRGLIISAIVLVVLVGLAFTVAFLIDEPLRRYVEHQMNQRLEGYTVRIGRLDFHPVGFSVDFEDLLVTQDAHPDPPIANFKRITASVHWRALLQGGVVADFEFDRPILYVNLANVQREATDERPVTRRGWQDALEAMYPLKINQFRVRRGEVTYEDKGPFKPLKLTGIQAVVTNVRNVRSRDRVYPSEIRLELTVFDNGRLTLDGRADFMAVPHPGVLAVVELEQIELDYLKPVLARYNVDLRKGTLSAKADLEYAPKMKAARLREGVISNFEGDYVQRAKGAAPVKRAAAKTAREAQAVNNAPGIQIKVDTLQVAKANVGFVNRAARVPYRVFLADANLDLRNLSNQATEGVATTRLDGKFMGTGTALVAGKFRPEVSGPDFDLDVRIENVEMTSMNDLLRAYGQFDVVDGLFSLYAEIAVKNQAITGYMKPLFRNLDVYDPEQDKHKGIVKKAYERVVGGVGELLKNRPRDEVATKTEVRGRVEDPKASTMVVLGNLVQNAFFKAILPGFENELRPRRK